MHRIVIAIGGGELRQKETLDIDRYVAGLAKKHAAPERGYAVFVPTASHDSKPYFNTFRKTYTSEFDLKADLILLTRDEMTIEKVEDKIKKADMLYVGGGDTKYMIETWEQNGVDRMIIDAYLRGVPIAGLSAGAICWFSKMYTDCDIMAGETGEYRVMDGLGLIPGFCCPHYNLRPEFDQQVVQAGVTALALENNSAAVFVDEELIGALTSGGTAYLVEPDGKGGVIKTPVPLL